MFVDDDEDTRELVTQLLAGAGFEVQSFPNAEEALDAFDAFDAFTPHVVVTDVTLPGLDGQQLALRIKNDPRTAHVPVVAVTGLWPTRYGDTASPFDAFLLKPISLQKLVVMIRELASPATEAQRSLSSA